MLRYSIAATVLITALMSIISINLAGLTLCFFGICIFSVIEYRVRQKWEMAYSFKIKALEKQSHALSEIVSQHDGDISMLKRRTSRPMARPQSRTLKDTPKKKTDEDKTERAAPSSSQNSTSQKRGIRYHDLTERKPPSVSTRSRRSGPLTGTLPKPRTKTTSPASPIPTLPKSSNAAPYIETPAFSDLIIQDALHHAVSDGSIDLFMQPVLRLPERKVRFFEVFTQIQVKPGLSIPAQQYADMARKKNVQRHLDRLLLTRILDILKTTPKPDNAPPFFLNISPLLFKDRDFMHVLLKFAATHRPLLSRIIFEIPHDYFLSMPAPFLELMKGLGDLGCGFSLDHVRKIDARSFDIPRMMDHKIRTVKLHHKMFSSPLAPQARRDLIRLKNRMEGNGIGIIAEKIENNSTLKTLSDFHVHYGQGYILGAPERQSFASAPSSQHFSKKIPA